MADPRPLLLGESPSSRGDKYHAFPLSGATARRLCEAAGIPPVPGGSPLGRWTWALYDVYECRNVFERHADAVPWDSAAAAARAVEIVAESRVVVGLGKRVAAALGVRELHRFEMVGGVWVAATWHPSGRNLRLNDPREVERLGRILRDAQELAAE